MKKKDNKIYSFIIIFIIKFNYSKENKDIQILLYNKFYKQINFIVPRWICGFINVYE